MPRQAGIAAGGRWRRGEMAWKRGSCSSSWQRLAEELCIPQELFSWDVPAPTVSSSVRNGDGTRDLLIATVSHRGARAASQGVQFLLQKQTGQLWEFLNCSRLEAVGGSV